MVQAGVLYQELTEVCRFAADQADALRQEPSARRWLVISLVIALQGACAIALLSNGYQEDVLEDEKLAAPGILLRRAASADYLGPEVRAPLGASDQKALAALIVERNAAIHLGGEGRAPFRAFSLAVQTIDHLLLSAPAFDLALFGDRPARLKASVSRLKTALDCLPED